MLLRWQIIKKTLHVRALAARALAKVISQNGSFSSAITHPLGDKDRSFYRELCFGTLRHFFQLNGLLQPLLKKPFNKKDADIHALLLIGLYQLQYLRTPDHAAISATVEAANGLKKPWAKGLLNAVLRNFLRQKASSDQTKALTEAAQADHPDWLYNKLKTDWPSAWPDIIDYNNTAPAMALRVNLKRFSREDYQGQLALAGIDSEADALCQTALRLLSAVNVSALPAFAEGAVSVQDIGAQLASSLLNAEANMHVLDACAAPGGKAVNILESAEKVCLTALDSSSERLLSVEDNLQRCGYHARCIAADAGVVNTWWDGKFFDRILLDAPCSGTGIISHHPDIKILRREADIASFAEQQKRLLSALWDTLKPGGELVYCTCSVMPEENHQIIEWFLQATPTACALKIDAIWGEEQPYGRQLLPNKGKYGGFFYARLSKLAVV